MTIDLIHRHKIRIDLSGDELSAYHVSYRQLSADDLQTRIMIGELLTHAKEEVGFDHRNRKLFIETYPHGDGGCILYVTVLAEPVKRCSRKEKETPFPPLLFSTGDLSFLCRSCAFLQGSSHGNLLHSSLFSNNETYCLAIVSTDNDKDRWKRFAGEWGLTLLTGSSELLRIKEHGKLLIPTGAVELLAKC